MWTTRDAEGGRIGRRSSSHLHVDLQTSSRASWRRRAAPMLRSDASVAAFAACVGFACYLNSVICGFVFDDRLAIIDNADVQHGAPLADVWVNDFWGKSLRKTDSHKSYRPLTVLSFRAHTWWHQGPPCR